MYTRVYVRVRTMAISMCESGHVHVRAFLWGGQSSDQLSSGKRVCERE